MSIPIWLLEVDGINPVTGELETLRFSTSSSYMTGPRDTPPNTPYPARVISLGNFERHCWQRDTTRGSSTVGFGTTSIDNADRALDGYKNYGFDGQSIRFFRGLDGASYPTGFTQVGSNTMQGVTFSWATMDILLRDRLAEIYALPIQAVLYGGTNVLPAGFDGVATDLQGKPKPIVLGAALNCPIPCVNTSKLTYQVTDRTNITIGAVTISAVYDKGVALTAGSSFATVAALQASTPTAGKYNWCDDPVWGAFVQLGSTPAGEVTCDASEGTLTSNTIAQIVTRIMTGPGGQQASNITGAAALDAVASGQTGLWLGTTVTSIGSVIDAFLQTCNGYLVNTRSGPWLLGQLAAPTAQPVLTVQAKDIKDPTAGVTIVQSNDLGTDAPSVNGNTPSVSVPLWCVTMNYGLNNQVQSATDLAGGAGLVRIGFAAQQYRQVSASNPSILAIHSLAPLVTFTGLFVNKSDAQNEAQRQLTLRSVHRDCIEVEVDPDFAAAVDLGNVVALNIAAFDWQTVQQIGGGNTQTVGKSFICIGMIEDYGDYNTAGKTTLVLWG